MSAPDDNPFGIFEGRLRRSEDCPKCDGPTFVSYNMVDDDSQIPPEVQAGKLPLQCDACLHFFYGNWK